jgi:putative endonuclease
MAYVYILTNKRRTVLYTGSTPDLIRRVLEHKTGVYERAFTLKYKCFRLAWYEEHPTLAAARKKERQLKRWLREWKVKLIKEMNPEWKDLSEDWYSATDLNSDK